MERAYVKYDRAIKDLDAAYTLHDTTSKDSNSNKKNLEQMRLDIDKKCIAAYESSVAYQSSIGEPFRHIQAHLLMCFIYSFVLTPIIT